MDTSWICVCCATAGTPEAFILKSETIILRGTARKIKKRKEKKKKAKNQKKRNKTVIIHKPLSSEKAREPIQVNHENSKISSI